jgi:Transcription initiation factor IIA, gamma subunit
VYKFNLKNVAFTMEGSVSVKIPDMRIIACKSGVIDPDAEAKAERAAAGGGAGGGSKKKKAER